MEVIFDELVLWREKHCEEGFEIEIWVTPEGMIDSFVYECDTKHARLVSVD